jgi:hypothetical protein
MAYGTVWRARLPIAILRRTPGRGPARGTMRPLLPVLGAGGAFAGMTVVGLLAGVWLAGRVDVPIFAAAGLFAGLALGGYSAYRLLRRSM